MFKPTSITNAIGLAKLQESSIEAITKKSRMWPKQEISMVNNIAANSGSHIRKELSKELEEKRAKGLCFKCNEKYTRGHVCNKKQIYAMEGEDGQEPFREGAEEENEEQTPIEELQISLNALTGSIFYRTMRVKGNVKKKLIIILIDSRSTHNFLSAEVAKKVGMNVEETEPLSVTVVDGTRMSSKAICKDFQ